MTLKSISLSLFVGQEIIVGPKNDRAEITKIEFHEKSGQVDINTTKGPRKALTFRLCEDQETGADKYR